MSNQTLLFLMTCATPDTEVRHMAQYAASENARLTCVVLAVIPAEPLVAESAYPYAGIEISDNWMQQVNQDRERLDQRVGELRTLAQKIDCPIDVQPAHCFRSDVQSLVARYALVSDMAFTSQSLKEGSESSVFRSAAYGVLFDAPIPLIMNATPFSTPKRIFLAWDTGLSASRAAHGALPYLTRAAEVVVGSFDGAAPETGAAERRSDLMKWLGHHGCDLTIKTYASEGAEIGSAILTRAAEAGADLVVMGSFGRSRLRERIFGGTTQTMIRQTQTPVLMAH